MDKWKSLKTCCSFLLHHLSSFFHLSFQKAAIFLAFWIKLSISSTLIWFTRTQHPLHTWVTGVSRKHISHILKNISIDKYCWSVSPQWDTGMLSHCIHQVLTKSNEKAAVKQVQCNEPHPSHLKNLMKSNDNIWTVIDFVHLSAIKHRFCHDLFLEKWLFLSPSSGNLVFLCMFWPGRATRVSIVTLRREREGLERPRTMTWARSLLPKTKTFNKPLTLHMPPAEREIISHHNFWNGSTVSKCVFLWSKDGKFCMRRWKVWVFWWNNF